MNVMTLYSYYKKSAYQHSTNNNTQKGLQHSEEKNFIFLVKSLADSDCPCLLDLSIQPSDHLLPLLLLNTPHK